MATKKTVQPKEEPEPKPETALDLIRRAKDLLSDPKSRREEFARKRLIEAEAYLV